MRLARIIGASARKQGRSLPRSPPRTKIARTVYHLLKYRVPYEDMGAEEFARKQQERDVLALRKRAAKLGFTLVDPEVIQGAA